MRPWGLAAARTLLLDDLSLSSHFLARDTIRNGADFAVANPDPGFKVRAFAILKNGVDRDPQQGLLTARLECRGEAEIWPPGQPTPEGKIAAVDVNMIAQPVDVSPAHPSVSTGGTLRLRIRGLPARRGPAAAPRKKNSECIDSAVPRAVMDSSLASTWMQPWSV